MPSRPFASLYDEYLTLVAVLRDRQFAAQVLPRLREAHFANRSAQIILSALQSAASTFGSNPQASQVAQVMTDRPLRTIKAGRIQVRFFVKRGIGRTPTQQPAQAVAPLCISTPEATVFDLVRYATSIGGIERAAETIRPLLPKLRANELKRVLTAEDETAAAQRLGFVIQSAREKKLAQVIYDWLPEKLTAIPLSPLKGERKSLPLAERWQILNNSTELK